MINGIIHVIMVEWVDYIGYLPRCHAWRSRGTRYPLSARSLLTAALKRRSDGVAHPSKSTSTPRAAGPSPLLGFRIVRWIVSNDVLRAAACQLLDARIILGPGEHRVGLQMKLAILRIVGHPLRPRAVLRHQLKRWPDYAATVSIGHQDRKDHQCHRGP